jgi:hypothetical protein
MGMRNAKIPVQCEICGKTVLNKGLKKNYDMAHGPGQKPAIIQATLENLPDAVVEQEGLRRGFIPTGIVIPMSIKARR